MMLSDVLHLGLQGICDEKDGAVPRRRGYMISGGTLTGKTILAMQIQYTALQRGESCTFVSINQPFWRIVNYYQSFKCWDIKKYINDRKLYIADHFSRQHLDAAGPVDDHLIELERAGFKGIRDVVFFADSADDPDEFMELHISIFEKKGPGGANIIDSLSDQLQFARDPELIIRLHQQAREVFASPKYMGTGFHIYSPDQVKTIDTTPYKTILDGFEDGTFEVKYELDESGAQRHYIRTRGIRGWCGATKWYEFSINSHTGVTVHIDNQGLDQEPQRQGYTMTDVKTLVIEVRTCLNRIAELDEKEKTGQMDEGRIARMKTEREKVLYESLYKLNHMLGDGELGEALDSQVHGRDDSAVVDKLENIANRRGWSDLIAYIGKHKDSAINLLVTFFFKAAEKYTEA